MRNPTRVLWGHSRIILSAKSANDTIGPNLSYHKRRHMFVMFVRHGAPFRSEVANAQHRRLYVTCGGKDPQQLGARSKTRRSVLLTASSRWAGEPNSGLPMPTRRPTRLQSRSRPSHTLTLRLHRYGRSGSSRTQPNAPTLPRSLMPNSPVRPRCCRKYVVACGLSRRSILSGGIDGQVRHPPR